MTQHERGQPRFALLLDRISAVTLPSLVVLVILRDLTGIEGIRAAARLLLLVSLIALIPMRARRRWPFMAAAAVLSAWVIATRTDAARILFAAMDSGAFVAAFFAALGILRHAAELSPAIARSARYLADRPPGRRFLALLAGGQAFALLLGYGALSLLGAMVVTSTEREPDAEIRRLRRMRMLLAVQHGFVSNLAWSPLSFGTILALTLVPGSSWVAVAPFAAITALTYCAIAWSLDWLMKPPSRGLPPPATDSRFRDLTPLAVLLVSLATAIAVSHLVFGLRASVSVMIIVPILSLAWIAVSAPKPSSPLGHLSHEARIYATQKLPGYGSELVLLSLASFLGTAGGLALAPTVAGTIDLHAVPASLLLIALAWSLPLLGYLGAHPLLSVSLLYPLLPTPAEMGVSPVAVVCAITAGWAISGATSPFTAAALMIGRFAGVSPFRVGAIWNGPFTVIALLFASAWIAVLTAWL